MVNGLGRITRDRPDGNKTSGRQLGASTQLPSELVAGAAVGRMPTCVVGTTAVAGTDNGTAERCASAPAARSPTPAAHNAPPTITSLASQVTFIVCLLSAYS